MYEGWGCRKKACLPSVLKTTTVHAGSSTHRSVALWRREQGLGNSEDSEPDWSPVHCSEEDDLCPQYTHVCVVSVHVHTPHIGCMCTYVHTHTLQVRTPLHQMQFFLSSFLSFPSFAVHSGIIIIALLAQFCSSLEWSRCRQLWKIPCYYTAEQMRMSKKGSSV